MTEFDASDVKIICVDGYNLQSYSAKLGDPGAKLKSEDRTALGDDAARSVVINQLEAMTFAYEGWFDDAGDIGLALDGKRGVSQLLCYGVEGNAIGSDFTGARGTQTMDHPVVQQGALTRVNAEWEVDAYDDKGLLVAHHVARGAAGNTQATPVDNLASTAGGVALYLFLTALDLDGHDGLVVTVRDADAGLVFADLQAFAEMDAVGAQRLVASGTVERNLAVSWAWTGAGTDPSATFLVGAKRL